MFNAEYHPPTPQERNRQVFRPDQVTPELQELWRPEVEKLKALLEQNDCLIVGIAARTGSTTATELLETALRNENTAVEKIDASSTPRTLFSTLTKYGGFFTKVEDEYKEGIVIVEEAAKLLSETDRSNLNDYTRLLERIGDRGAKLVIMTHDSETKGVPAMRDFIEKHNLMSGKRITEARLECLDRAGLEKLFDTIVAAYDLPSELQKHKQEIIALSTTPQNVNRIIASYQNARTNGKDDASAWDAAKEVLSAYDERMHSFDSLIGTTGGKPLWAFLKRVAENKTFSPADMSDEEKALYERYKLFHFFEEKGGAIQVRGEALARYAIEKA